MLKRVEPLRNELQKLEDDAKDNQQKANEVEQMIRDLEASIARYKEEYAVLISEAQAIKADLAAVEAKVRPPWPGSPPAARSAVALAAAAPGGLPGLPCAALRAHREPLAGHQPGSLKPVNSLAARSSPACSHKASRPSLGLLSAPPLTPTPLWDPQNRLLSLLPSRPPSPRGPPAPEAPTAAQAQPQG